MLLAKERSYTQRRDLLAILLFIVFAVCMLATTKNAQAAIATGTSGTCSWEIDDDGVLTIRPTDGVSGTLASYTSGNGPWYNYRTQIKKVVVEPGVKAGTGCVHLFYGLNNCMEMDLENLNTSDVTDMGWMFSGCSNLTSLDVSGWDTSNVMNMASIFYGCSGLTSLDVSGFNTGNVTDMTYMFCNCSKLTSLDVPGWDTSNVTNTSNMFMGCSKLATLDVSGWDTSNVMNMAGIFYGCSGLTSLDVSNWDTSKVTNMNGMFRECSTLTSLDVSGFNTGNVTNMRYMFYNCSGLTSLDVSGFNTGNVTDMTYMFYNCSGLTNLDVSGWDTSNVMNMASIFYGCSGLTSLDVSGFNTGNVTDMTYMFYNCSNLTSLDASNWDTSKVTDMESMFNNCSNLTSLDVSGFDTGKVTHMNSMFSGCSSLASLDISGFDTGKVTNMSSMFYNCSKLTTLDVSGFNTGNVTNMRYMFSNCSKLSSIKLSESFSFSGKNITKTSSKALLPTPSGTDYTGKWIKEDESAGPYTAAELRNNYNGAAMAGTWVWQEKPNKYTIQFTNEEGAAGAMASVKTKAAEAATLPHNKFYMPNYQFDHWEDENGNTYPEQGTIPANTFNIGDTVTLTAHFVPMDGVPEGTQMIDLYLTADEMAKLKNLPGGAAYQIWEETPSGWQLVRQENPSGQIAPNATTNAVFMNKYIPGTATLQLTARKTLDGQPAEDGAFEFQLIDPDGEVVQTKTNNAAGMIQFDQLVFREPGTFRYKVREVRGSDEGINYDTHTEVIDITVEDDGSGNLSATSSKTTEIPTFENLTKPGTLTLTKQTVNGAPGDKEFTFEIELQNELGQSLDSINVIKE